MEFITHLLSLFAQIPSLFSGNNKKQIEILIKSILPLLSKEWKNAQPKLKILLRRGRPIVEKRAKKLTLEIEEAAKAVDQEFSDTVESIFSDIGGILKSIGSTGNKFIDSNIEVNSFLKGFSISITEFGELVTEELNNIESQQEVLFDNLCEFENILSNIENNLSNIDLKILNYSKSDHFRNSMLNNYDKSKFKSTRFEFIEEILDLHCLGFYGGSIALLYSQIEGIITDTLIETGHAEMQSNSTVIQADTRRAFPGLKTKMEYIEDNLKHFETVFNKLIAMKIPDGKETRSISQSRNIISHGNTMEVPNESLSLSLLLSLYVIIIKIRLMSDV